jgi:ABC-type transport system involved in cytochrome c biogenesis ATPase subunit
MKEELIQALHLCHLECGVPRPGVNQRQYHDLCDNSYKLSDFITIIPILWSTIVNFSVTIYMMKTDGYVVPVRLVYAVGSIALCALVTYLTDPSVYEKITPPPGTIVSFGDPRRVGIQMGLGYTVDGEYKRRKRDTMDAQQRYQSYVIIFMNVVTTYVALMSGNIAQLHSFSNISWMIGCLSNHLKSLQYHTYMAEFIAFMECMKKHRLKCSSHSLFPSPSPLLPPPSTLLSSALLAPITCITFKNATFGYYKGNLLEDSGYAVVVHGLDFTFIRGKMYYLEATNGIGKSTLLKMFTSNLHDGTITFDGKSRANMSFEDIHRMIIQGYQASEYSPAFSKDDTSIVKGKDLWLEKQLGLHGLFDKDFVEMSGGQKKRMLIYMLLTAPAFVLLLDEILSELSTEDVPEVPEGGGWLGRVISTLVQWPGRTEKFVILVGHGLRDIIPKKEDIVHLRIEQGIDRTNLTVL